MFGRKEILDRLLDDKEYYGEYGQQWLSASSLKHYLKNKYPKKEEECKFIHPLEFGNAFHQSLLEPLKFQERVFLPDEKDNALEGLKMSDRAHIEMLSDAVLSNKTARAVLEDGNNRFEVPYIGTFGDIDLKCKVDIEGEDCLWDLKTTGNLKAYPYTSVNLWGYPLSAWQYYMLTGKTMNFIVVEKNTGRVKIVYSDEEFYRIGRVQWQAAMFNYRRSLGLKKIFLGNYQNYDRKLLKGLYGGLEQTSDGNLYAYVDGGGTD